MKKVKIGITGSFGRGNYGDELYLETYKYWFSPWAELHLLSSLPRTYYLKTFAETRVNKVNAIVLGGGDLICPYKENVDPDFINTLYLKKPLHVAGVGVEQNKPDIFDKTLRRWQDFLRHDNVRSITMRDPLSKEWIEQHIEPKVDVGVTPDLVCGLPLPQVTPPDGSPILGLVTRHIKHPREYEVMRKAAELLSQKGWRVRHIIGGVGQHGRKDFENAKALEVAGKETFYSENLDKISMALGECSLVLSMKLHTTIVASMYGVATISMNPVVKARQFMDAIGRSDCVFSSHDDSVLDFILSGVPAADSTQISRLRGEASSYLIDLGRSIWVDANKTRRSILGKGFVKPSFPKLP